MYAALRAGARGFLLEDADTDLLVQAVHAAARGDALIAPSVTVRLLQAFAGTGARTAVQPLQPLSPREEEVLRIVARGLTNAEIARDMHLSPAR